MRAGQATFYEFARVLSVIRVEGVECAGRDHHEVIDHGEPVPAALSAFGHRSVIASRERVLYVDDGESVRFRAESSDVTKLVTIATGRFVDALKRIVACYHMERERVETVLEQLGEIANNVISQMAGDESTDEISITYGQADDA